MDRCTGTPRNALPGLIPGEKGHKSPPPADAGDGRGTPAPWLRAAPFRKLCTSFFEDRPMAPLITRIRNDDRLADAIGAIALWSVLFGAAFRVLL